MPNPWIKGSVIFSALIILTLSASAQQPNEKILRPPLEEYKIYLNGRITRTARTAPARIMKLDNNGEILLACRMGRTKEQLEAMGISLLESQLRVLIDWRLLEFDRDVYTTAIPIFGEMETAEFRSVLRSQCTMIASELAPGIKNLKRELTKIDQENRLFVLLYAYVFHDLFWRLLRADDFYVEPELTAQEPFWSGTLWALYPAPDFNLGTMAMGEDVQLHINSVMGGANPELKSMIQPFTQFRLLGAMSRELAEYGRVNDEEICKTFAPYGIIDRKGNPKALWIREKGENRLFKDCESLAQQYHDALLVLIDSEKLAQRLGVDRKHDAVLITFYEFKWILLDHLVMLGDLNMPAVMQDPGSISYSDIGDLIFITDSTQEE